MLAETSAIVINYNMDHGKETIHDIYGCNLL